MASDLHAQNLRALGILPASAFQATVATGADAVATAPAPAASEGWFSNPARFFTTLGAGLLVGYLAGSKNLFGGK